MAKTTLGEKIANLRREKGYTQEELAEKLSVSPQAVSKWENDISCPDIMLLPELAKIFGVTTDTLLGCENEIPVTLVPAEQRKKTEDMVLRIIVNSADNDKVRINIPLPLLMIGIESGIDISGISGGSAVKNINWEQILSMVESGVIGKLVEVESGDGDIVEIVVEEA